MQHLLQDNVKVSWRHGQSSRRTTAAATGRGAAPTVGLVKGRKAAGDRDREARATSVAGEKSKERGAEFGGWCRNEAL